MMFASATALEREDEIAGMAEEGVQETARYGQPLSIMLKSERSSPAYKYLRDVWRLTDAYLPATEPMVRYLIELELELTQLFDHALTTPLSKSNGSIQNCGAFK